MSSVGSVIPSVMGFVWETRISGRARSLTVLMPFGLPFDTTITSRLPAYGKYSFMNPFCWSCWVCTSVMEAKTSASPASFRSGQVGDPAPGTVGFVRASAPERPSAVAVPSRDPTIASTFLSGWLSTRSGRSARP